MREDFRIYDEDFLELERYKGEQRKRFILEIGTSIYLTRVLLSSVVSLAFQFKSIPPPVRLSREIRVTIIENYHHKIKKEHKED